MKTEDVLAAPDVSSIYEVPLNFEREQLGDKILKKFGLAVRRRDLHDWRLLLRKIKRLRRTVSLAIVGKYFATGEFTLADSYISVIESIKHAAWQAGVMPKITWLDAEDFERRPAALKTLAGYDGIIVPGGFGSRGVNGKISAIRFARTGKIPYFGLCYGLQLAVVEFARNVAHLPEAHTTEINPSTRHPVIDMLPEQRAKLAQRDFGGTMRLGEYRCRLKPQTQARLAYGKSVIFERHRHRYEVNNAYLKRLERYGLIASGINPDRDLVEIIELTKHPFFVGVQFHPEFKTYPLFPHPLFSAFIRAAVKRARPHRANVKTV